MVSSVTLISQVKNGSLSTNHKKRKRLVFGISFIFAFFVLDQCGYVRLPTFSNHHITKKNSKIEYSKYSHLLHKNNSEQGQNATISPIVYEKLNEIEYRIPSVNPPIRDVFVEIKDIKRTSTNIFFVETRCSPEQGYEQYTKNKAFILNARQCCAIESTALNNLDREIYIFHSCPVSDDFFKYSPKFVERLFTYPNVHLVRLNNTEIFKGTPVQELYENRLLETSRYPVEHASDIFRFLLMWRFGGVYCDLDIITIRSFNALKTNWGGAQDSVTVACGVMSFEPSGPGHRMVREALVHLNKHFDGVDWAYNGPLLITPIILRHCNASSVYEAVDNCKTNFTVLPTHIHYPIFYAYWRNLFDERLGKRVVKDVKSKSFTVHIWNKMSHDGVVRVGSTQAYSLLASEFCPEVYQHCGDTF